MRDGHIGMKRGLLSRRKHEAVVNSQINIVEHVEGSTVMAFGWFVDVCQ